MERKQLKQTLETLHRELETQVDVDPELKELLGKLDQDIHHLIAQEPEKIQTAGAIEAAESLATRFAAKYPSAEAVVREIVAILGRMGV